MSAVTNGSIAAAKAKLAMRRNENPAKRTQGDIVRDYREVIISLIVEDKATHEDVAAVLGDLGEEVLRQTLANQILQQIGSVAAIRAGRIKPAKAEPSPGVVKTQTFAKSFDDDDFRPARPKHF